MHDAVDAGGDFFHRGEIGEVGGDEILVGGKIGGLAQVAPADVRINAAQKLAQARAEAARGSGNENFLH